MVSDTLKCNLFLSAPAHAVGRLWWMGFFSTSLLFLDSTEVRLYLSVMSYDEEFQMSCRIPTPDIENNSYLD